jgi:hypothetical protein
MNLCLYATADPLVFEFVQSETFENFSHIFLCHELSICLDSAVAVHGVEGL